MATRRRLAMASILLALAACKHLSDQPAPLVTSAEADEAEPSSCELPATSASAADPAAADPVVANPVALPSCTSIETIAIGEHAVAKLDDQSLWFRAGMTIDADGSPRAYHPDDTGLDALGNAGRPGNWWALVTDANGEPIVQGRDDPAPGYYVSMTSLFDRRYADTDPRRYVDAETVPYVVLPSRLLKAGVRLGDLALVVDLDTGRRSHAIFADVGPAGHLGEGSIALAEALGLPSSPRRGGKARGLVYLVWPHSGERKPLDPEVIARRGQAAFQAWGGQARLDCCLGGPWRPAPSG